MQSKAHARQELKNLKLRYLDINQYIAKFEDLAQKSGYNTGNAKIYELFLEGLNCKVLKDVMSSPIPQNHTKLKQKVVNIVRSMVLISNILKGRGDHQGNTNHPFNTG